MVSQPLSLALFLRLAVSHHAVAQIMEEHAQAEIPGAPFFSWKSCAE